MLEEVHSDNSSSTENSVTNIADAMQRKSKAASGNVWAERKEKGYKPFKPVGEEGRLPRVEETDDGGFTIANGELIHLRLAICKRAEDMLPKHGIFLRQGRLFSFSDSCEIDLIPPALFAKLFCNMRVSVTDTQEIPAGPGKTKRVTIQRAIEADLTSFDMLVTNTEVTRLLIKNRKLKEIVYENEVGESSAIVTANYHIPKVEADTTPEAVEQARRDFNGWLTWMDQHKPKQLAFFAMMLKEFMWTRALGDKHQRRLNIGIGPNGSGKGSMVRMLELIPKLAPIGTFDLADALCEYRSGNIFSSDAAPLLVCHEWKLDIKTPPQIQAAFKAALRGEAVNARTVGSATQRVKSRSGFVLFCNTDRDKESTALEECYDYFGAWHATDRFNVAWIDWFRHYPEAHAMRTRYLSAEAPRDLQAAFGLAVYEFGQSLRHEPIAVQEIPPEAVAERAQKARPAIEKKLDALLFAWGRIMHVVRHDVDEDTNTPAKIEKQQKVAREILRGVVGKTLEGYLTAEHFFPAEGFIRPSLSSALFLRFVGLAGNRQWRVPEAFAETVLKGTLRTRDGQRGILFVCDAVDDGEHSMD
jgi:hypothetical protein